MHLSLLMIKNSVRERKRDRTTSTIVSAIFIVFFAVALSLSFVGAMTGILIVTVSFGNLNIENIR